MVGGVASATGQSRYQSALFFSHLKHGRLNGDFQLGYSQSALELRPSSQDNFERADIDSDALFAYARIESAWQFSGLNVTPGAGLSWFDSATDGFTLASSDTAIDFSKQNSDHLQALLSLRLNYAYNFHWGVFTPQLEVVSEYCIDGDTSALTVSADGSQLSLAGIAPAENHQVQVNLGAGFVLRHDVTGFINYNSLERHKQFDTSVLSAGLRLTF